MVEVRSASILRIIPLLVAFWLIAFPAHAQYSGGSGTAEDPYQIATAADLIALGETRADYDKHFLLTADIDLDPNLPGRRVFDRATIAPDVNDTEDGFQGTPFTGVLDGNDHTISNLTMEGHGHIGLFGLLYGEVRGLRIENGTITASGDYVGGLVGQNCGRIAASCTSGIVNGRGSVGGLVGQNGFRYPGLGTRGRRPGYVVESYSTAEVGGESCVGGLVGWNMCGSVSCCYSSGPVGGGESVGGLVGYNNGGTLVRCYSTGSVAAMSSAGGLVGAGDYGDATDCFWDVKTSGQSASAAGVGKTTAEMQSAATFILWGACTSVWTIDNGRDYPRLAWENKPGETIPGPTYAGGLGTADNPYLIAKAEDLNAVGLYPCQLDKHFKLTADIDLSGHAYDQAVIATFAGVFDGNGHVISGLTITGGGYLGLFGQLESGATVKNLAVVNFNVSSGDYVGALTGQNQGTVTQCRSTGLVLGNDSVGGLVGCNLGSIDRSFCSGSVTGHRDVGGFAGANAGTVTRCYSTSEVMGTTNSVGGLIGQNSGTANHCYSTGRVAGGYWVGGLVGENSGNVLCSVWDMETSLLSGSAAGVGLTTTEMMDPYMLGLNGFGNDPNWILDAGRDHPHLVWEGTTGDVIPEPDIDWLVGDGTEKAPYQIGTADQLILLGGAGVLCDRHFVLTADIDLDPSLPNNRIFEHAAIPVFTGVFDGNDHAISHLTIRGIDYLGLFGYWGQPGAVKNVSVVDVNIAGSGDFIGGLVGWEGDDSMVIRCDSIGMVSGKRHTGGLVGFNYGTVTDCVSGGTVSGTDGAIGGLVGSSFGMLSRCQSSATVAGDMVGGLVGQGAGTITQCCSTGAATGEYIVGGLVGRNFSHTLTQCYSTADVSGNAVTGGLVGENIVGTLTQCYSAGRVSGIENVGGLVGYVDGWTAGIDCFWDTQISGQTTSAGGTGKTTAEMQTASTFLDAGWDFVGETANGTEDIWRIDEGKDYPRLWWEAAQP